MTEYINRKAFLRQERDAYCRDCTLRENGSGKLVYEIGGTPCKSCDIFNVLNDLVDFPAADVVKRRVGTWIEELDYNGDPHYVCSACGEAWVMIDGTPQDNDMYYCPNCGAVMDRRPDDGMDISV